LIVLFVSNVPILQSVYSQQNTASTTNTGPTQQESNITIKIVVFLIFCYAVWTIYKRLKYRHGKYRKRQYFPTYIKEDAIRMTLSTTTLPPVKANLSILQLTP
jgi:hypothetical protein